MSADAVKEAIPSARQRLSPTVACCTLFNWYGLGELKDATPLCEHGASELQHATIVRH